MIARTVAASLVLTVAACTKTSTPPDTRAVVPDSADQVMFGAKHILTDRGVMRAELHADTAFFFDESTRIEMSTVRTVFFKTTGTRDAVLTSREGTYSTRGGIMEARGNVVIQSEDARRLTTEQLRYDVTRDEISSDSAFVLTEPGRRLAGIGFTSDPDMTRIKCLRACGGSGGSVVLPGQEGASTAPPPAARPITPPSTGPITLPGQRP